MLRTALALSLLAFATAPSAPSARAAGAPLVHTVDEVEDLVEEVRKNREETDLDVLDRLSAIGTQAAAEGLIGLYETQGSLYIRIEIVRRLPKFDGSEEAGQIAMKHLMDVSTASPDLELRDAALDGLGASPEYGRPFLEQIVESAAEDEVRERAMDLHVEGKSKDDEAWYRKVYEKELGEAKPDKKKSKKKDDDEPEKVVYKLPELAYKAFEAIVADVPDKELTEALDGDYAAIQYIALEEYSGRNLKKSVKFAEDLYKHPETPVRLRALSARIMKESGGKKVAKKFVEDAGKFATPDPLRLALADLIAEINDPATSKKLERSVTKGKPYEKRFVLRALVNADIDGLDEDVRELLTDENSTVRFAACEFLVKRGDMESAAPIEAMMKEMTNPVDVALVMDQLGILNGKDSSWEKKLLEYVDNEEVEVRNSALTQLGRDYGTKHLELLTEYLKNDDWSTRLASIEGLASLRDKRTIGPIIQQMQNEVGRMKVECANVLFDLTGQPFRAAEKNWLAWWEREGDKSDVISLADLEKAREREELRRLKQVTNSTFFGIRIISHRVLFIIDVSGSMEEQMRVQYEGDESLTRMAVARRELTTAIRSLERGALFNIITFSSGVDSWLDNGVTGSSEVSRDEAEAFVARLKPGGATNLYDSIKLAFEDTEVDTIFILSDGEPTAGEVTNVNAIRSDVAAWNEHRRIEINTIGIGSRLNILEWLAEDSGGKHVKFR